MKVIHVLAHSLEPFAGKLTETSDWTNAEHHVINLISDLVQQNNKIQHELWTLTATQSRQFQIRHKNKFTIKVFPRNFKIFLPLETSTKLLVALFREIRSKEDRVWHIHSYYLAMFNPVAILLRIFKEHSIAHHRGGGFTFKSLPYSVYNYCLMLPLTLRLTNQIFVQNTRERRRLISFYKIRPSKIKLIPNYFDTAIVVPKVPRQKTIVVAYSGRIINYKGVPEMIGICEQLIREGTNLKLKLIGTGELLEIIKKKKMSWIDCVGQKNTADNLTELKSADIFLFGTRKKEGSPKSLIEAQGLGLPAVAYECEGVEDIIIDHKNGFLVDNPSSYKNRLFELIQNTNLRARMSKCAVEIINQKFNKTKILNEILSNYRNPN